MIGSNPPRPRIYRLRVEDPEKAIDDPALGLLAASGWTVAGSFAAEEQNGIETRRFLVLVLWPPRMEAGRGWRFWILPAIATIAVCIEIGLALFLVFR